MITFGQGTAIFQATKELSVPVFGDIDGDGDLDAFVGQNDGTIAFFRNEGTATAPNFVAVDPSPFNLTLPDPSIIDPNDPTLFLPDPNSRTASTDTSPLDPGNGVWRVDPNNIPNGRIGIASLRKRSPLAAKPTLVDIDGDGDLDIFVGEREGSIFFFENIGTPTNAIFAAPVADPFGINRVTSTNPAPPIPPQTQTAFSAAPKFVDIDGDGDLDMFVARNDRFGASDGNIEYFENIGSATSPTFVKRTGAANPFNGITTPVDSRSVLAFADVDGDGDIDALIGESVSGQGTLRFFENQGTANAPNFVERTGADNPFNALNGMAALEEVAPDFADLNGDGRPDLIIGTRLPADMIRFFENTTPIDPPPPPPPPPEPPLPPPPLPPPPLPPGDLLMVNANNVFTIGRNFGNTNLKFNLAQTNTGIINEVGFFKVDDASGRIGTLMPGSAAYVQAALARAQAFFSALPAEERPNGFGVDRQQGIEDNFTVGDRFALYLINSTTSDAVLEGRAPLSSVRIALTGNDTLQVRDLGNGQFTLGFEEGDDSSFDDVVVRIEQTGNQPAIGVGALQQQGREILDLLDVNNPQANLSNRRVQATFTLNREAVFNNTVGLYRIDDAQGTVNGIAPEQAGYAQAAIERRVVSLNLNVGNQQTATTSAMLNGDTLYAPFLIANASPLDFLTSNPENKSSIAAALGLGPPQAYFVYLGANPDRADHIRLLGDNTFGFEDLPNGGDQDFNDLIFTVDIAV
jgi:hypothetical protein